jgi:hypothetical protein
MDKNEKLVNNQKYFSIQHDIMHQFQNFKMQGKMVEPPKNIFITLKKNSWNFKPKIMKKDIWFDHLTFLSNQNFCFDLNDGNGASIITSASRMLKKIINHQYFKFSGAFGNLNLENLLLQAQRKKCKII